jgi:hypothetical protein
MLNEAFLGDMEYLFLQLRRKDKVMHLYLILEKIINILIDPFSIC